MSARKQTGRSVKAVKAVKKTGAKKVKQVKQVKKAAGTRSGSSDAFASQKVTASPALAAIIGDRPMSREQVVVGLWNHIQAKGLLDKDMVKADGKLAAIFGGKKKVTMFELTILVNRHLR